MIKKILYKNIDFQKYNDRVKSAEQSLFFGTKEYLDTLIPHQWEILVLGDYQAVMPIPLVYKFGFKIVIMPMQTQQLGVFSEHDNADTNQLFVDYLEKNYWVYQYSFNAKNKFLKTYTIKDNFVLLPNEYAIIKSHYSMHRRRNVRIVDKMKSRIHFEEILDLSLSKDFIIKNNVGLTSTTHLKFINNMKNLLDKGFLKIYTLKIDQILVSMAFVLVDGKSCTLVGFANDKDYLKYNSSSIIIDQILQKSIANHIFSFHGSSIPAIADFYSRFGAEKESFSILQNSKIGMLKNLFLLKF